MYQGHSLQRLQPLSSNRLETSPQGGRTLAEARNHCLGRRGGLVHAIYKPLKMKVRAGGKTGLADQTNLLVLLYAPALLYTDFAQMPIAALMTVIVFDTHVVPQLIVPAGRSNHTIGNAADRGSLWGGIVHTFVVAPASQNRVNARPVSGADSQLITSEG